LGKVKSGENCIDLIYRAGNGLCEVDDLWFERARDAQVFGLSVKMCAPEEIVWMKAFIMERERFDGADVAHIFESCAAELDWRHLLKRFGSHWPVLLSHIVLFGYIYPSERGRIACAIIDELLQRWRDESSFSATDRVCQGTLLSREQYLPDIYERGFRDDTGLFLEEPGDKGKIPDWMAHRSSEGATGIQNRTGAGEPGVGFQSADLLGRRLRSNRNGRGQADARLPSWYDVWHSMAMHHAPANGA